MLPDLIPDGSVLNSLFTHSYISIFDKNKKIESCPIIVVSSVNNVIEYIETCNCYKNKEKIIHSHLSLSFSSLNRSSVTDSDLSCSK